MQIEFTSRGLLGALFRHKIKLLLLFTLCVTAGIAYAITAKKTYETTGSLIVKFGRSAQPDVAQSNVLPNEISQNDRREILQSNILILQSRDLLRPLVNSFGAERLFPDLAKTLRPGDNPVDAAILRLQSEALVVRMAMSSTIIEAHFLSHEPQLAADFLSKLFDQFIARQSELFNKPQTDFLTEQVRQAAAKLAVSQQALREFKIRNSISSIDEEQKRLLEQKMMASNIALEALDKSKEKLEALQAEEAKLLATYQSESPAVTRLRQSMGEARRQVNERQADMKHGAGISGGTLVAAEVARVDRRIQELESVRMQNNDLERQVALDEADYKNYAARNENARINETLNEQKISRVAVLDAPMVPSRPSRPRKMVILLISLLSGALLGLCAALLAETMDDRFTAPMQLGNTLQLPVMGSFFVPQRRAV
jgi:uncharacterized protein involved in exopolysaccharide biosynthesis